MYSLSASRPLLWSKSFVGLICFFGVISCSRQASTTSKSSSVASDYFGFDVKQVVRATLDFPEIFIIDCKPASASNVIVIVVKGPHAARVRGFSGETTGEVWMMNRIEVSIGAVFDKNWAAVIAPDPGTELSDSMLWPLQGYLPQRLERDRATCEMKNEAINKKLKALTQGKGTYFRLGDRIPVLQQELPPVVKLRGRPELIEYIRSLEKSQ